MERFGFEKYVSKCECPGCGRNRLGSSEANLVDTEGEKDEAPAFRCYCCGSLYIPAFKEGVSEEDIEAAENPADLLELVEADEGDGVAYL